MANATTARWHGDDYQARVFWDNALNLLDDDSCVIQVTFEANKPKSFDDVVVRYDPPVPCSGPKLINAEYYQVKWHVDTSGRFGYEDFICPKFINARSTSLLQRLKNAREQVPEPGAAQFIFLTTDKVKDGDPLAKLISNVDRTLILERLFDNKTDKSRMGRVRCLWRNHLRLSNDDELKYVLDGFRIFENHHTLDHLRKQINTKAKAMGIKGMSASNIDFRYDGLARQLKMRKQNTLTRETLAQLLRNEGLFTGNAMKIDTTLPVAIRSFLSLATDVYNAKPENTLLLTDQFKQRYLRDDQDWQRDIRPRIESFLHDVAGKSPHLRLILDAHASIAYLSGTVLHVKSAVKVHLVQKGRVGTEVWRVDDDTKKDAMQFSLTKNKLGSGNDIVVAISVAQPVEAQVRQYVAEHIPSPEQLLTFTFSGGPGHQTIAGGEHAAALAEQVINETRQVKQKNIDAMVHIFAAVPNSLMFYLGQHHQSIAPCIIYEYDFDRRGNKTYHPSFIID